MGLFYSPISIFPLFFVKLKISRINLKLIQMADKNLIEKICSLYLKNQYSMVMVAEKLKISPNKVQYWLEKNNIPRRNNSEAGYLTHQKRFNKFPSNIKKKFLQKEKELLIAGIMLYWAEGWKKNSGCIAFSNSNPKMIQLFLKFLREICGIYENRLRVVLHLYENQKELELKKFWSKITRIPLKQFNKSHIHKGKSGTYKKKSKYGTLSLRYGDKKLLKQILKLIEEYTGKFLKRKGPKSHLSSAGRAFAL